MNSKAIQVRLFGSWAEPHAWYPVGDPSRPNVFWIVRILERGKKGEKVVGWGDRERINLDCPKYVWTAGIANGYYHVVSARYPKISRLFSLGSTSILIYKMRAPLGCLRFSKPFLEAGAHAIYVQVKFWQNLQTLRVPRLLILITVLCFFSLVWSIQFN